MRITSHRKHQQKQFTAKSSKIRQHDELYGILQHEKLGQKYIHLIMHSNSFLQLIDLILLN
jgi:hypothetical protein